MTERTHISQEDLVLYAMQALTPEESVRAREHFSACPECRDELARASADLALLALSTEQKPLPEGIRKRFLAKIDEDAHEAGAASAPALRTTAPVRSFERAFQWSMGIAWASAAALIVVGLTLGVRIHSLNEQLQQKSAMIQQQQRAGARAQAILSLLTSPAAKHVVLTAIKSKPAPAARAVYLASQGALLLQASNLDAVPGNKAYELWVIPASGAPIPAGLFRPDVAGNASVVLPSIPTGVEAKAFGVTVENAEGSSTPTAPIVLEGAVPAGGG